MLIDEKFVMWLSCVKLLLARSCKQIQIGVCEQHNNVLANSWQEYRQVPFFVPTVCQHVVVSFTHTNLCLPT